MIENDPMSSLAMALKNAGFSASSSEEKPKTRDDEFFADPRELSDSDLLAEFARLTIESNDISGQLADDKEDGFSRDQMWRGRARKARRIRLVRLDQISFELKRRNPHVDSAINEQKGEKFRAEQAAAEERKREKAAAHAAFLERGAEIQRLKAERIAIHNKKSMTQAELFVKAAHFMYSRDDCDKIWERAKTLFPHNECWTKLSDGKQ